MDKINTMLFVFIPLFVKLCYDQDCNYTTLAVSHWCVLDIYWQFTAVKLQPKQKNVKRNQNLTNSVDNNMDKLQ